MIKLKNQAIDSFRLYIPLEKCKFTEKGSSLLLQKKLTLSYEEFLEYKEQLESLKEVIELADTPEEESSLSEQYFTSIGLNEKLKREAYIVPELKEEGITLRLLVLNLYEGFKGNLTNSKLQILVNSKLLKERYFEGITINTIKLIYNEIIKTDLVYISYEDFLKESQVVDIDIKADFNMAIPEFKELQKFLIDFAPPNSFFDKKENLGIEYSYRKNVSHFKAKPFIKLYYKPIELFYNSRLFSDKYLPNLEKMNLVRIEGTIKNKKHLQSLGIKENNLETVLKYLTPDKITSILMKFLNRHLKAKEALKLKKDFTVEGIKKPSNKTLYFLIKMFIEKKYNWRRISIILSNIYKNNSRNTRTRYKSLAKVYYDDILYAKSKEPKSKGILKTIEFFDMMDKILNSKEKEENI